MSLNDDHINLYILHKRMYDDTPEDRPPWYIYRGFCWKCGKEITVNLMWNKPTVCSCGASYEAQTVKIELLGQEITGLRVTVTLPEETEGKE